MWLCLLMLLQQPVEGPILDSIGARIEARMEAHETTATNRYQGLRTLLEDIKNRPEPILPKLHETIQAIKEATLSQERSTGPIREALQMVSSLVSGLIVLVVICFVWDVYKTMFKK